GKPAVRPVDPARFRQRRAGDCGGQGGQSDRLDVPPAGAGGCAATAIRGCGGRAGRVNTDLHPAARLSNTMRSVAMRRVDVTRRSRSSTMRVRSFLIHCFTGLFVASFPALALAQAAESLPAEAMPAEVALPAGTASPALVGNNLDLFTLILHASIPVQLVMLLLVIGSIASWMIIFRKKSALDAARRSADAFEERFWSGADLAALFRDATDKDREISGIEAIFEAG